MRFDELFIHASVWLCVGACVFACMLMIQYRKFRNMKFTWMRVHIVRLQLILNTTHRRYIYWRVSECQKKGKIGIDKRMDAMGMIARLVVHIMINLSKNVGYYAYGLSYDRCVATLICSCMFKTCEAWLWQCDTFVTKVCFLQMQYSFILAMLDGAIKVYKSCILNVQKLSQPPEKWTIHSNNWQPFNRKI